MDLQTELIVNETTSAPSNKYYELTYVFIFFSIALLLTCILDKLKNEGRNKTSILLKQNCQMKKPNTNPQQPTAEEEDKGRDKFLRIIAQKSSDPNYRIRLNVMKLMPFLAEQLGSTFFDSEKLSDICTGWLVDRVSHVRRAAARNLGLLVEIFGEDWAKRSVIPQISRLSGVPKYRQRLSYLNTVAKITPMCTSETVRTTMLPTVIAMVNDRVPEVRCHVARVLQKIGDVVNDFCLEIMVMPELQRLEEDKNFAVSYVASLVIYEIKAKQEKKLIEARKITRSISDQELIWLAFSRADNN